MSFAPLTGADGRRINRSTEQKGTIVDEERLAELRREYEAWLEACRLIDEQNYRLWEGYCERRSEAYFIYRDVRFVKGAEALPYPPQPGGTHRFNYPRVEADYTPPSPADDEPPF
jgi:hypothetical protein